MCVHTSRSLQPHKLTTVVTGLFWFMVFCVRQNKVFQQGKKKQNSSWKTNLNINKAGQLKKIKQQ